MKGIAWLISGLMLALLLVSSVSVGSQLSLPSYFSLTQDLQSINQISGQVLSQVNKGLDSQLAVLQSSATVISTWDLVLDWVSPIFNWLADLWARIIDAWQRFLGRSSVESQLANISPAVREKLRQDLLAELRSQGLIFESLGDDETGTKYGVAVTPSTGSPTQDELFKNNFSQIFADRVDLRFDRGGMTGVVTPVFRDDKARRDYIFVLKPLL